MTLNQLKYVIEIANTGSINKASQNLFISQSVLSTSLKNLENELGKEIFVRSTHGIQLTPFGKTFISYIKPIQLQLKQLDNILANQSNSHTIILSIASNGFYFISKICSELYKKYASVGIRIEEYEGYGTEAMNLVATNIAEIGLVRQWSCYKSQYSKQYQTLKLQFFPLITLDIGVTIGPCNPLFYQKDNYITPEMLKPYPMVMYSYMDTGPYSDIFNKLGLTLHINRFVTSSRATIYENLATTDAFFLNSNYNIFQTYQDIATTTGRQRTLLLKDCKIKSEIGWIKNINTNLTPIAREAIDKITEYLTTITS